MRSELPAEIFHYITRALEEDIGSGDVTTDTIVPANATLRGRIIAKEDVVVAGLEIPRKVMLSLVQNVNFGTKVEDGMKSKPGTVLVDVYGLAKALLTGEQTAQNFLVRVSGNAIL